MLQALDRTGCSTTRPQLTADLSSDESDSDDEAEDSDVIGTYPSDSLHMTRLANTQARSGNAPMTQKRILARRAARRTPRRTRSRCVVSPPFPLPQPVHSLTTVVRGDVWGEGNS